MKPYSDERGRGLDLVIVESFLTTTPVDMGKLNDACLAGDTQTFQRLAHSLKSTCAAIGAEQLVHVFEVLEMETPSFQDCLKHLAQAETLLKSLQPILENYLRGTDWSNHG